MSTRKESRINLTFTFPILTANWKKTSFLSFKSLTTGLPTEPKIKLRKSLNLSCFRSPLLWSMETNVWRKYTKSWMKSFKSLTNLKFMNCWKKHLSGLLNPEKNRPSDNAATCFSVLSWELNQFKLITRLSKTSTSSKILPIMFWHASKRSWMKKSTSWMTFWSQRGRLSLIKLKTKNGTRFLTPLKSLIPILTLKIIKFYSTALMFWHLLPNLSSTNKSSRKTTSLFKFGSCSKLPKSTFAKKPSTSSSISIT